MPTITISEVKKKAISLIKNEIGLKVLLAEVRKQSLDKNYDVFLSHSIRDTDIILGVKGIIEDLGYTVYVD